MTKPPRPYGSAGALRQALETRVNARAGNYAELQRLRRLVAFDRLLARLFLEESNSPWMVKGGYGLEIRYQMAARSTKDVDVTLIEGSSLASSPEEAIAKILDALQEAAARDIGDYFVINIGEPQQEFDAAPEGGARFPVEVYLDGRIFAKFHLDVGIGDTVIEQPEWRTGEEFLSFAGIPPARIRLIPVAQQIAEKLHSYTLPRAGRSNSRVKDLVDLLLILDREPPETSLVKAAVEATFQRRSTHPVPNVLPSPPVTWFGSYSAMAKEVNLNETNIEGAWARLNGYWTGIF